MGLTEGRRSALSVSKRKGDTILALLNCPLAIDRHRLAADLLVLSFVRGFEETYLSSDTGEWEKGRVGQKMDLTMAGDRAALSLKRVGRSMPRGKGAAQALHEV
jgi:hypothetical protein